MSLLPGINSGLVGPVGVSGPTAQTATVSPTVNVYTTPTPSAVYNRALATDQGPTSWGGLPITNENILSTIAAADRTSDGLYSLKAAGMNNYVITVAVLIGAFLVWRMTKK